MMMPYFYMVGMGLDDVILHGGAYAMSDYKAYVLMMSYYMGPVESVLIRKMSSIQGWIVYSGAPQCGHCWDQ